MLEKYWTRRKGTKKTPEYVDNRWIVAYNPCLSLKYQCHINVEYCGSVKAIKYLFKYILKGNDRGSMELREKEKQFNKPNDNSFFEDYENKKELYKRDEITLHKMGRIMSANEGHYNLEEFKIHSINPKVLRLPYFIPTKRKITVNIQKTFLENQRTIEAQNEKVCLFNGCY